MRRPLFSATARNRTTRAQTAMNVLALAASALFIAGKVDAQALTNVQAEATQFVPYFNYDGDLAVTGTVFIESVGTTQNLVYAFRGMDPECVNGASDAANSCGIHIHEGTSCSEDGLGHYYTGEVTEDPWVTVSFTSLAVDNSSTTGSFAVTTGGTADDIMGRALVVHAFSGARIACAIIKEPFVYPLVAKDFVPYFNYEGNLASSGEVGPITTSATGQSFSYSLSGVDPACSNGASDAANSCGLHIHAGTSCAEDGLGHYYTGVVLSDPWTNIGYSDAGDGAASGSVTNLFTGATQADLVGRAVVIHDYTGARVACAIITALECPAGCSPITVTPEVIPLPSARRLLFATNPPTCPEGCATSD